MHSMPVEPLYGLPPPPEPQQCCSSGSNWQKPSYTTPNCPKTMIMKVNKGVEEYLKQVIHMKLLPRKRAGLWRASGSVLQVKTTRNTCAGVRMSANKRPGSIAVVIQHSGCVATAIMTTLWRLEVMGLISLFFFGRAAVNYKVLYFYQKTSLSCQNWCYCYLHSMGYLEGPIEVILDVLLLSHSLPKISSFSLFR